LLEPANQFLPEKIRADRRNGIRGQAEFLQMIGNVDGGTARKKPTRQAVP
jgi:hypothetical protein